jgi:hypothetical protein
LLPLWLLLLHIRRGCYCSRQGLLLPTQTPLLLRLLGC